jgi:CheY-like chemotaxis protein
MKDKSQFKILMIEDNETHRFMYDFQFKKSGYEGFQAVATGEEGLDIIKKEKQDLIFLDLILADNEGLDGMEVLRKIKSNPESKNTPVLVLSNKREKDMGEEASRLGAAGYLLKAQFVPRQIVEQAESILNSIN